MNDQNVYPSSQARQICTLLYGKTIYPSTWRKWREEAEVEPNQKMLTKDQYFLVCSIAFIRKAHPKKHLTWELVEPVFLQIESIVNAALINHSMVYQFVDKKLKPANEKRIILGSQIQSYLESKGLPVPHTSSLYKKIDGFSMDAPFTERQILAIFKPTRKDARRSIQLAS